MDLADEPIELNLGDDSPDPRPESQDLLNKIKAELPRLEALYADVDHRYEDGVYRYYHGSFKVYALQSATLKIVERLRGLSPDRPLNASFEKILSQGTGKTWREGQRPEGEGGERHIVETFFPPGTSWRWRFGMERPLSTPRHSCRWDGRVCSPCSI